MNHYVSSIVRKKYDLAGLAWWHCLTNEPTLNKNGLKVDSVAFQEFIKDLNLEKDIFIQFLNLLVEFDVLSYDAENKVYLRYSQQRQAINARWEKERQKIEAVATQPTPDPVTPAPTMADKNAGQFKDMEEFKNYVRDYFLNKAKNKVLERDIENEVYNYIKERVSTGKFQKIRHLPADLDKFNYNYRPTLELSEQDNRSLNEGRKSPQNGFRYSKNGHAQNGHDKKAMEVLKELEEEDDWTKGVKITNQMNE